ncbi:MAG TPA: universal stress protein [Desulfomonilia bacterium]|nr:universal stress protein [Desulfomonilia bacterium]
MKKTQVKKPQKILCYIDFAKHSPYLVDYAYQLSRLIDAELFVLHTVTDIKGAAGFYVPHINTDKLEEEVIKAAKDKMYAICSQVAGEEIDTKHRLIMRGSPIDVINKMIQDKGVELLILSHDLSKGALSQFRSDHAEKFMKNPSIPFLVLPVK